MDAKMNEKIILISEILSMDFKKKRINNVLKILDEEIELLEKRLDNLAQKKDLTSEEEQKELLLRGKVYDQEKYLLIIIQNLMKQKKELTKKIKV